MAFERESALAGPSRPTSHGSDSAPPWKTATLYVSEGRSARDAAGGRWTRNMTERVRSADELGEIARYADELPVAIWVGRVPSGECVYVNREFRQVLGIDPPEGAARANYVGPYSVHTHEGKPYPEAAMPYERVLAARAPIEVDDLVIHRHDGGRTYLRVYARPLFDASGVITHVLEAFTDITREVASQRAQLERDAQLRQAQRMESLGSLAGGIAHDFNNLLTVIRMISTHLSSTKSDPEVCAGLTQIDEVTESATRLTRALLGFARQGKNLRQRTNLKALIIGVAELSRRTVGRQIEVLCSLCDEPLEVEGDPSQLEQLLMNLVVNARDAIEGPGRLSIGAWLHQLDDADDLPPGPYALIEVDDTGTGIPAAVRDRIFEPYFTTKTQGAVKGTGLGLATVFGIVESHKGRVHIARTGPSGTTMRVLLPLQPGAQESPIPDVHARGGEVKGRGTVLVVDDEPLVLRIAARALEELGYRVFTAADGQSAVQTFGANRVDAVVLDLVMPVMGGRETFRALHAIDPEVKVLLITGYGLNHEAQELLDLGVRGFLAKPFSIAELSTALARLVDDSPARSG
jgi:signal transduction histidine kinase/ActR/RegA family two-component response regulator